MKAKKNNIKPLKLKTTLSEIIGMGKESFKSLGGGENFLKNERKQWR